MTRRPIRILVLTAAALAAAATPAPAQLVDAGKKRLPRLFADAVAAAADSTVRIQADGRDVALGTIVSADGHILTKGSELHGALTVFLRDGSVYDARQVGYHKPSDLALLKIDAVGLKPVTFADPKFGEVGNWVAATKNDSEPVAVGVISAAARKLYLEEAIVENANKGYLGITLMDLKEDEGEGVRVRDVTEGAAAAKAGLKAGDVIIELDGKPIKNRKDLLDLMDGYRPGDRVKVLVRRGEAEKSIDVRLGARESLGQRSDLQNAMGGALSGRRTGFPKVIQHDTVIRPSDCGGPLVDLDGKVLGINIARAGRVETWALPGDVIQPILKELKDGKYAAVKK